jgi:drug/metabolite transporter (DMT)-like permease
VPQDPRVTETSLQNVATHPPPRYAVPAVMAITVAIWGSTWVVVAHGLDDLPPFTAAGVRFTVSAAIMLVVGGWLARKEGGARSPLHLTVVQGTCNFAVPYALTYHATLVLPSSLVAILWALFPVCTALTAPLLLPKERFMPKQWLALLVAVAGVVLLFQTDLRELQAERGGVIKAALLLLLAPLLSALGTGWIKRTGTHVSAAYLNRDGLVLAAALLMGCAWTFEGGHDMDWTANALGSVLYLSLFGTVITFGLYFWAVRHAPVWQLSMIALMTPGVALVLGSIQRQEPITRWTLGGLALILLGVVGVLRGAAPSSVPNQDAA